MPNPDRLVSINLNLRELSPGTVVESPETAIRSHPSLILAPGFRLRRPPGSLGQGSPSVYATPALVAHPQGGIIFAWME
jgi:hypothetical protein